MEGKPDEDILAYATIHERVLPYAVLCNYHRHGLQQYSSLPAKIAQGIIVAKIRPRNANQVHKVLEHLLNNIEVDRLSKSLVIVDRNKYRIR